ncbi:inositol monophosphatase family protein [Psychromarinibacter halotolerans]|uniref:Inositol-1-monophosphatase n=1 Tax=Psychromarinibacter halotolerans TaxID=1775175 RepID=A0ABV7GVD5_9RHOB|nr:inositol monophosphatase [Psychromarinibacter halotolerans]MDF0598512.1 inositol monophosphatase [Psychromarinibacter halotolerans]
MSQADTSAPRQIADRADICLSLIRSAGRIALNGFRRRDGEEITMKGSQDFLTETDAAVEAHLKARLAEALPGDDFLGEETGGTVTGQSVWVVDPIDGTANFARGIPHFCISIAYVRNGVTELGAIFSPATDELWFARRGEGATCNGAPIKVASTQAFSAACLELGWNNRRPQQDYLSVLTRLLDHGANVRRCSSGALGLAYVADGRSDGYAELHMNAWDCLAGLLLVEEAGGRVSAMPEDGLGQGGAVLAVVPSLAAETSAATGISLASQSNETERARMIA